MGNQIKQTRVHVWRKGARLVTFEVLESSIIVPMYICIYVYVYKALVARYVYDIGSTKLDDRIQTLLSSLQKLYSYSLMSK